MTGIDCGSKVNFHCTIIDGYSTWWNGKRDNQFAIFFFRSTDKWHHLVQVYRIELNANASSSNRKNNYSIVPFIQVWNSNLSPIVKHKTKITLYTLKINTILFTFK